MPKPSAYALIWSDEHQRYDLHLHGQLHQSFPLHDESAWLAWVQEHTTVAFHGQAGHLSLIKEARPRGSSYWYAYRRQAGRTHKRYLGPSAKLTFAHLEQIATQLTRTSSSSARALDTKAPSSWEPRSSLLSARLSAPRLPSWLVERPRLLRELDAIRAYPLTLFSASAGSGKTTLLSAWVAAARSERANEGRGQGGTRTPQTACAWLSLDALDREPIRFWSAVIAALQTALLTVGQTALALLHSQEAPPLSAILTNLLQELEQIDRDLILILDDYQLIADQSIQEALLFMLEHLPANMHLVLVTRVDPALPLSRLRLRGQLLEVRDQDLRFTQAEATSFLVQGMGLPLSQEEVAILQVRTEGWVAGLQLAALALRKRDDRSSFVNAFAGSHHYLLDYVQQDILAHLPADLQAFVLQTAILPRMNAALCQAVTVGPSLLACQQRLEELEHANLFVVPLDDERQWYRYHDLFREALLAHLRASQPDLLPVLHQRAACFYEAQGQWHEAITHALGAADYSTAANLMEQTIERFWVHGEATTIAHWVLALPEQTVREHAPLLLTTALYLLNTVTQTTREQRERRHREVRQLMARVETTLRQERDETDQEASVTPIDAGAASSPEDRESHATEEALLCRRLRLLHMQMVFFEALAGGEYERLNSMQQEIEEALDHDEEAIWQIIPLGCTFRLHYTVRYEGAQLLPRLLSAREQVSRKTSPYASLRVRQYLAFVALEAGQLHLAYEVCQGALDLIEQMAGYALLKGYFEVVLTQVWYQWNRLEDARSLLHTIVQQAAAWQHLDLLGRGYEGLFQVELARGDGSAAQQALLKLEQLIRRERFAFYPGQLPVLEAQWRLEQGQVREASDWMARVAFSQGTWEVSSYDAFPVVMRVYFAELRFREAVGLLERFSAHLDRPTNIRITITYLAQYLVALYQTGKSEQARAVAARLFALTETEGHLRAYLNEGEPMREALEALLTPLPQQNRLAASTRAYIAKLLAAFAQEKQGVSTFLDAAIIRTPESSQAPQASHVSAPVISLTRREQEVLRLLAKGASNQDIAQALVISLETVKKHVSNLLSKLEVSSRTQAVAQARARSLL